MRIPSFLPIASIVVTGWAGMLMSAPAQSHEITPDRAEQICAPFMSGEPGVLSRSHLGRTQMAPIGAPPPAPPPPPQMSTAQDEAVAVTGRRVAQSGYQGAPRPLPQNRERYDGEAVATIMAVSEEPVSTFSIDVDTGSYANVRRFLNQGGMPPQAAVRTEEMLNYFRYDYDAPRDRSRPFTINTDVSRTPWNENTRLLRIGLRGYDVARNERPAANLVFLVDVSGSMHSMDKLPLARCAMAMTAEQMRPDDRISIVTYAGSTKTIIAGSNDREEILAALSRLQSGGSTAGAAGLQLAYDAARANMIDGGINRIMLATDGDFNVGTTNRDQLIEMVEREREAGISLTTLGFGTGNYNEAMMEQIADHGNGNYAYIDSAMEAHRALVQELSSTLFTIASDVKIQIEFNPIHVREYRLIGYENRLLNEEDFANDSVDAGEIGAGHQVTAIYEIVPADAEGWLPERRYEGNRVRRGVTSERDMELADLRLRYKLPGEDESRLIRHRIDSRLIAGAQPPRGDMAFAVAVAAFGQRLRGDTYLGDFGFDEIRNLAQRADGRDYWRNEFIALADLAAQRSAPGGSKEGARR